MLKKLGLFLSVALFPLGASAQIMSENFDSLNPGDYMGVVSPTYWTTWSGAVGGAEDVQVSAAQANSGSNSIYLVSSQANDGPQDVVLDLGQQFTSGVFTFESMLYIVADKKAYFNFQSSPNLGTTWVLNFNAAAGSISIDNGITSNLAVGSYPAETWFSIKIEANLSLNIWKAYVDGVQIGMWQGDTNTIAAVNLYPILGSEFYVDDISFNHEPYTPSNSNAAIYGLNVAGNIAGLPANPTVEVINAGVSTIASFDVTVDYNGAQYTRSLTNLDLPSTSSMAVVFSDAIPLVPGSLPFTATVSNVNGAIADDDPSDDAAMVTINPLVPAVGKVVVAEAATGTWCPWCPRAAVYMDRFEQDFGRFGIGIEIHNGDPMSNQAYSQAISNMIPGYPSALVDRGVVADPGLMSSELLARLTSLPTAFLSTSNVWDAVTRELRVTITAEFQFAANSDYKLAVVLTEDGVIGSSSDYNQANAYSGGANGPMGGFELLPSPVPAASMVYNRVARAIEPSFAGDATVFPENVFAGEIYSRTFWFDLEPSWNAEEINVIGLLIDPSGEIDNASKARLADREILILKSGFEDF